MVCYCPIRKIIYIHVPKTGGLSVEKILVDMYGFKHFTFESRDKYEFIKNPRGKLGIFRYILKYSRESKIYDLKSFFKFALIRDPYSRGISAFRFLYGNCRRLNILFPNNLEDFYERCKVDDYFYLHFLLTQHDVLADENGEVNFDYIGRFENFQEDLEEVLFDILKFPRKNISSVHVNKSNPDSIDFNQNEMKSLIELVCKTDFEFFGYELKYYTPRNILES